MAGLVCFIPARSGSKRLKRKATQPILGKPLIAYTIEAALAADVFSRIIVTSDAPEVLAIARDYGVMAHDREPALAADTVTVPQVLMRLLTVYPCDAFAQLLPTSPLREATDIVGGYELFTRYGDTVMSVTGYPHPPQHAVAAKGELVIPWRLTDMEQQSQRMEPLYYHEGSFIFCKTQAFLKSGDFYAGRVRPYHLRGMVDVNTAADLAAAEVLLVAKRYLRGIEG